jgi:hypothetical protein
MYKVIFYYHFKNVHISFLKLVRSIAVKKKKKKKKNQQKILHLVLHFYNKFNIILMKIVIIII